MVSDLIRGNQLLRSGKLEEAVAAYRSAIAHNPSFHWSHYKLGEALEKLGRWEDAIAADQKAVELKPTWERARDKLEKLLAQIHHTNEASAYFQSSQQQQPKTNEVCEYIWKGLHQLGSLDETSVYCQTEIQWDAAKTHFIETSQYKVMTINSLIDGDKAFLEKSGFSIANLELMIADDINLEEKYINSFEQSQNLRLAKKVEKKLWKRLGHPDVTQGLNFQQSMVETGYIYSICPVSGRILRSNQSFNYGHGDAAFIYRFVGVHVFYLIVGGWGGSKRSVYFPHLELILNFRAADWYASSTCQGVINTLKSCAIVCWQQFKSYIANEQKREVVALSGSVGNIGHFFWNEMSGLQNLFDNRILDKIDRFLVSSYEYFSIAHLFPEIPTDKFSYTSEGGLSLFKTIISQNYFVARFTDLVVKEDLANRVSQAALKRCSPAFLQEVEQIKQHFPLLWVGCRQRSRAWISQVEGTANIIKSLYSEFPNLGVVFGGWSPKENEQATPWEASSLEAPVKIFVEQVLALLPPYIKTYNAFGRPNYENIVLCNTIDLYVAPMGSETAYLSMVANKPGVLHSNTGWRWETIEPLFVDARENCVPPVLIAHEHIIDQDNSSHMTRNYDCDWQVIYDEVIKMTHDLIISKAQGHRR